MDFAFRGHQQGYRFYRCKGAIGHHYDAALRDFATYCQRRERASQLGALLFRRHPELRGKIPTFRDKEPLSMSTDPPRLAGRKIARALLSTESAVTAMRILIRAVEAEWPDSPLLVRLYRWTISAHLYRGYRRGLREMGGSET
jgi:hypothetical protein